MRTTTTLPDSTMPIDISNRLREAGTLWAQSEFRPRVNEDVKRQWDGLVQAWSESDLPLAIRKGGGVRGRVVLHRTGRKLVICDNSPAQWAFNRAFCGLKYGLDDIAELIRRDEIPFAYATKTSEKEMMTLKCTLRQGDNINKCGWKLCHIADVGLSTRTALEKLPLETLIRHFQLVISPSNHFVVPLQWAGFGELPEVIDEVRQFEAVV